MSSGPCTAAGGMSTRNSPLRPSAPEAAPSPLGRPTCWNWPPVAAGSRTSRSAPRSHRARSATICPPRRPSWVRPTGTRRFKRPVCTDGSDVGRDHHNDPQVDARLSPSQPAYPRFVAKDPNPYAISMNALVCTVHVPLALTGPLDDFLALAGDGAVAEHGMVALIGHQSPMRSVNRVKVRSAVAATRISRADGR